MESVLRQRIKVLPWVCLVVFLVGLLVQPELVRSESRSEPNNRHLTVLTYHRFTGNDWIATPMDQFRKQMNYLLENSFTFLTMEQVSHHLQTGRPFPPNSVLIMVDDGYLTFYQEAWPFLKKHGIPVVVSPYTEAQNGHYTGFMDWEMIGELSNHPLVHIASHTFSHSSLPRVAKTDTGWYKREIRRPILDIFSRTATKPMGLVLPYGVYSRDVKQRIVQEGIHSFAVFPGVIKAGETKPPYPRFALRQDISMKRFKEMVNRIPLQLLGTSIPDGYRVDNFPDTFYVHLKNPDDVINTTLGAFFNGRYKELTPYENGVYGFPLSRSDLRFWNQYTISGMDPTSGKYRVKSGSFVYEPADRIDRDKSPRLVEADDNTAEESKPNGGDSEP